MKLLSILLFCGFTTFTWGAKFEALREGVVRDTKRKLLWQKCSYGHRNAESCSGRPERLNWQAAKTYCEALTLAGKKWRLPTADELRSLVDCGGKKKALSSKAKTCRFDRPQLAIDPWIFPETAIAEYWTGTLTKKNDEKTKEERWYNPDEGAMTVDFSSGGSGGYIFDATHYVRCVSRIESQ